MTGHRPRATRWRLCAGQATGPGHARTGAPCQDRFDYAEIRAGVLCLTVADGAGSRIHGEAGAAFAVEAATAAAREVFGDRIPAGEDQWRAALVALRRRTFALFDTRLAAAMAGDWARADGRAAERSDFATTLCTVIATRDAVGYVTVGDAFVVAWRDPGGPQLIVPPPLDRDHAGVTTFLTSRTRAAAVRERVIVDDHIRGLAVSTDGLLDALLDLEVDRRHERYFVAPPALDRYFDLVGSGTLGDDALSRTLASPDFAATSDDDKTLIVAVRE